MADDAPPYDYSNPNDRPGGVPATTPSAPLSSPNVNGAPYNYNDPNDRPAQVTQPPTSTPLDQPMPAIWNRPTGQGIGGYLLDTWAHQTQGAQQTAEDEARVAADTWSIGQADRGLSGELTGPELEAERAKTDAAHARLSAINPAIDYASQGLGYIVPGPADAFGAVNLPAKGYAAAAPYVAKAIPAASKATQDAIARVAAYAGHSGLVSAAQDIGHGIYNAPQIIGDTAVGATIGGAIHGANEAVSAGVGRVKDWWKGAGVSSGTPADITAANPTNLHAAKLEEWQNNMAVTGKPPEPGEVEAYGNQQFGADKSKWPAEYQSIYKSVQPRDQLGLIPRVAMGAGAYGLQYAAGLADNPVINYGVQTGLLGAGEFGSRLYRGDPVARADKSITGSYPALTGWNSTGNADPFAWRDALHRGLALPLAQPQN
jgi:hypothetical protein